MYEHWDEEPTLSGSPSPADESSILPPFSAGLMNATLAFRLTAYRSEPVESRRGLAHETTATLRGMRIIGNMGFVISLNRRSSGSKGSTETVKRAETTGLDNTTDRFHGRVVWRTERCRTGGVPPILYYSTARCSALQSGAKHPLPGQGGLQGACRLK
jgi:hypothetical protein